MKEKPPFAFCAQLPVIIMGPSCIDSGSETFCPFVVNVLYSVNFAAGLEVGKTLSSPVNFPSAVYSICGDIAVGV